jgi:hypothetical protein
VTIEEVFVFADQADEIIDDDVEEPEFVVPKEDGIYIEGPVQIEKP